MNELVLYNIPPSLCSQKVRLALVEKKVSYRNRWVDIGPTAENYEPWYVKLNPKCVVPTLVNGDEVITDSAVIMRYVAEQFEGPSLLPEDPAKREQMEHWYALAESLDFRLFTFSTANQRLIGFGLNKKLKKLRAYANKYPELRAEYEAKIKDIAGLKEQSGDQAVVQQQRAQLEKEFDALDAVLADHPFIAGATYTLADVIWTVSLTRLSLLKQDALIEARPNLLAYYRRMQARPSYEKAMLYPSFKLGPMLPIMARVLGPKLLMAAAIITAIVVAWGMLGKPEGPPTPVGSPNLLQEGGESDVLARLLKPPPTTCDTAPTPESVSPPAPNGAWPIRGNGVGIVPASGRLPDAVLTLEEKTYKQLVEQPLAGLDDMEVMKAGLVNQDGNRTLQLTQVDLMVELTWKGKIVALWPGNKLRTPEGTGAGSTLGQLVKAHGGYHLSRMPEPFHCSVSVPGHPGLSFLFPSCEKACSGAKARRVVVFSQDPED